MRIDRIVVDRNVIDFQTMLLLDLIIINVYISCAFETLIHLHKIVNQQFYLLNTNSDIYNASFNDAIEIIIRSRLHESKHRVCLAVAGAVRRASRGAEARLHRTRRQESRTEALALVNESPRV